jgi:uncharacterized protein YndB with AHSA1/START domain
MDQSTFLPAEPSDVWEVLTSPDGVESWLGEGSDLPPVEGASLDVADVETGVRRIGRVETVEPGRRLGFVWWPEGRDEDDTCASRVELVLTPDSDGTRLDVIEIPLVPSAVAMGSAQASNSAWAWRSAAVEMAVSAPVLGRGLTLVC